MTTTAEPPTDWLDHDQPTDEPLRCRHDACGHERIVSRYDLIDGWAHLYPGAGEGVRECRRDLARPPEPRAVFGPGRPAAAVAAIDALRAARTAALIDPTSAAAARRLAHASTVRALYPEYGDTFRGH